MKTLSFPSIAIIFAAAVALLLPTMSFAAEDVRSFQADRAETVKEHVAKLVSVTSDDDSAVIDDMEQLINIAARRTDDDEAVDTYQEAIDAGYSYASSIRALHEQLFKVSWTIGDRRDGYDEYYWAGQAIISLDEALLEIYETKRKVDESLLTEAEAELARAVEEFFAEEFHDAANSASEAKSMAQEVGAESFKNSMDGSIDNLNSVIEQLHDSLDDNTAAEEEKEAVAAAEAAEEARIAALVKKVSQLQEMVVQLTMLLKLKQAGASI